MCDESKRGRWIYVADTVGTGRGIRVLSVVDAFTQERLGSEVDSSFKALQSAKPLQNGHVESF